jgi:curved DNA-binding protein CbpA
VGELEMKTNFYEILEVSPNASPDIIETVYKRLAKRYHPDLQQEMQRAWAETKMIELNLAYDTLKNPFKRRQYDVFLMKGRSNYSYKLSLIKVSFTQVIQIIKAKLEKSKDNVNDYRILIAVPLILLFGVTVLVLSFNSPNKPKDSYEQAQLDLMAIGSPNVSTLPKANNAAKKLPEVPDDRFTLGSSQADVKRVMGEPTFAFLYSLSYGSSLVYFDQDGRVDGWAKVDKSLKAWLGNKVKNAPEINIGSSKEAVIAAMGTPTSVFGRSWCYGKSTVNFDENDKVENWVEIDKHLKVVRGSG